MTIRKIMIILAHAFIGWALCAAVMGLGMAATTLDNALLIHAIAAPVFFFLVSLVYFKKFNFTTPLHTGLIFVAFIILMDFFVVAMLINRSFDMFASWLGTWAPFVLIFLSTYMTGLYVRKQRAGA